MSSSLTSDAQIDFAPVCACEARMRSACDGEPIYKYQGQRYCVMHYPDESKRIAFREALEKKLEAKDFNFKGVWFPDETSFTRTHFEQKVDFMDSTFNGNADFSETTFSATAYFARAKFKGQAYFTSSTFKKVAYFRSATFVDQADFYGVNFKAAAKFNAAAFHSHTSFEDSNFSKRTDFRDAAFNADAEFINAKYEATTIYQSSHFTAKCNFTYSKFEDTVYFGKAKFSKGVDFTSTDFGKSADFYNVIFAERAQFRFAVFGAEADFGFARFDRRADFFRTTFNSTAKFNNCNFESVGAFESSVFSENVDFSSTVFKRIAGFSQAIFKSKADFYGATFLTHANFSRSTFNAEGDFFYCTFGRAANFSHATFKGYLRFCGGKERDVFGPRATLDFQYARIEEPDHISFNTTVLYPHWFINVDARKFDFTNVDWSWRSIKEEVESLQSNRVSSPHRMLAIACRHLAVNAEESHRYEEASKFRYMAMDARRHEKWRGFALWRLSWWYWLASGYGERILRAFVVLIGVWLLFAVIYYSGDDTWWKSNQAPLTQVNQISQRNDSKVVRSGGFGDALIYSAGVMTFQKPEPLPANKRAKVFVLLETVLGPLQVALLALAIRRKFMR